MPDLADGETFLMQGSGSKPYLLKNVGGVYSCTCPAWRNQSLAIEKRTCKHLRKLRGDEAEQGRGCRSALVACRTLGRRYEPGRLVDVRKARRRPRLLDRQGIPVTAW